MEAQARPDLTASYLAAVYRVQGADGAWHAFTFDVAPGRAGDDPRELRFPQPWAIITAWNPGSRPQTEAANRVAHARLVQAVKSLGRRALPAESCDAVNPAAWHEEGVVVGRLELPLAGLLLRVFRQNAGVYCRGGRIGLLTADPLEWRAYPMRFL